MCGVRGRWPSSSCHAVGASKGSSRQASGATFCLSLKRCTSQFMAPTAFAETQLRSSPGKFVDTLTDLAPTVISYSSSFEGTAFHIVKKPYRRQGMRSRVVVTNVMVPPSMNSKKRADENVEESGQSEDLKDIEESSSKQPQLELRKPGHALDPVARPVAKHAQHVDVPVVNLNVRPIVQVRPKRIPGHSKNVRAKVPKLLTAHREARPRFSSAVACSPEVQTLVAALRRSWRQNRSIDDVMAKHPRPLSPFDITCVLTELQRQHDWQCTLEMLCESSSNVKQLFSWSKKQKWYRPNSRLYTRLVGFLGREGQVKRATLLFQEMLLERCQADQYTYTALVNAYGKAKLFKEALAVFNYMKECTEPNCQPNTVTCNALIDALVKGGLYDQAVETFCDMRDGTNGLEHGCEPNVVTYNVLIDALCKEGLIDIGIRVLQYMREGDEKERVAPNSATYNTIIDACGKGGLYEKAENLIEEMVEHGVQPDHITYTALLGSYGKAGLWESAENMFKGMRGANVTLDVMAYTAMIDAYAGEGMYKKAEELFKSMQQSGIRPNQITYLSLIDAYGKAGLPEESMNVFNTMQAAGYEGNVVIYSALVDAYGKSGKYLEAAKMLDMMRQADCQPNLITYAAILSSCSRSDCWEEAHVLLQSLQMSNSEMESTLYKVLSESTVSDELWEDVTKMFDELKRHSKPTRISFCNSLLDILWSWRFCERASHILQLAREKEVYDDSFYVFTKMEWCLDLHRLSAGAAMTMLMLWLGELHHAWVWGEDVPETVVIISGKGKHSKSKISGLKAPVDSQLAQLCSPFTDVFGNCGRVVASGDAVQSWLLSPVILQRLKLMDEQIPQHSNNKVIVK